MNILPKKRWHVRTKENIARVRKDEAEAAQKEKEERQRIENADREARLHILKNKSKQRLQDLEIDIDHSHEDTPVSVEHVNLFTDLEHATKKTNREHDEEIKEKKEEYEKKIGYLTYLGQDTNEALGKKNWYEVLPQSSRLTRSEDIKDTYDKLVLKDKDGRPKKRKLDEKDGEIDYKLKQKYDPILKFKEYCEGKHKTIQSQKKEIMGPTLTDGKSTSNEKLRGAKKKIYKSDKNDKLQKLREARLKREREEKYKTEMFLTQLNGCSDSSNPVSKSNEVSRIIPKYNSQFNPELARQNYR